MDKTMHRVACGHPLPNKENRGSKKAIGRTCSPVEQPFAILGQVLNFTTSRSQTVTKTITTH